MKCDELENLKVNVEISSREFKYNDWRDWFILKKSVYETPMEIYLNDMIVYKLDFPINSQKVTCNIKARLLKNIKMKYIKYIIPEMSINKRFYFHRDQVIKKGNSVNVNGCMDFGTGG